MNSYHIYYTTNDDQVITEYIEFKAKSLTNLLPRLGKVHIFEMWCNGSKVEISRLVC